MNNSYFGTIQMMNFGEETDVYKNITIVLLSTLIDTINGSNVSYDLPALIQKAASLKIVKRDGVDCEYIEGLNTIYLSTTNADKELYEDETIIVFLAHELMHFSCVKDNGFYTEFTGYDECFTDYLAFHTVSRCGGIKMESYYNKNIQGYFDEKDNAIIQKLVKKTDFSTQLDIYLNRDKEKAKSTIGVEPLKSLNEYCEYYEDLFCLIGKPLKELRVLLQNPILEPQKNKLDAYVNRINQQIDSYSPLPKKI